jgi:hypothetical protein
MRALIFALVGVAVIVVVVLALPSSRNDGYAEKKRDDCVKAIMSNMGHSTVGYADKAAYDKVVDSKCN